APAHATDGNQEVGGAGGRRGRHCRGARSVPPRHAAHGASAQRARERGPHRSHRPGRIEDGDPRRAARSRHYGHGLRRARHRRHRCATAEARAAGRARRARTASPRRPKRRCAQDRDRPARYALMRYLTLARRRALGVLAGLPLLMGAAHAAGSSNTAGPAGTVPLPALCAKAAAPLDLKTPIPQLRRQVEQKAETDPQATVAIMCMAIPRVAHEYGGQSPELAWWVASLTMPMIAYLNQFSEAEPLLQYAQPILERRYGRDGVELGDIHVAHAWIYQREGRYAESEQAWERALHIRERFPGARKIELQKVLVGLALVRVSQGEFPLARAALQREHDILAENGDLVSEAAAAVENVYTNLAFREERFLEARTHVERQIAIEEQLKAGIGQFVPAYVFLARIDEQLGDYEGSEAASREAIRLAQTDHGGPLQRHQLTALTQLGALLDARGRPREALPFAQQAVALGETTLGSDAPALVTSLQSVADIQRALGRL